MTALPLRRAPPEASPLIDAEAIRRKIGGMNPPSTQWVRRHVPGKITLSYNVVRWYEADVDAWIAARMERAG